jgi:Tfp pilus assembly protein PilO
MSSGKALARGRLGANVNLRLRGYSLWIAAGAAGAVVLLLLGWLLLIRPVKAQTEELRNQVDGAQDAVSVLQRKLAAARLQNGDLNGYLSKLAKAQAALPNTAALSTFLDDVQAAGSSTAVEVRGLIVGSPVQVNGVSTQIYALPISLTAAGTATKLDAFLDRLQRVQPRAVLVSTANAAPDSTSVSLDGAVTLILGLRAFVAPGLTSDPVTAATPTTTG